MAASLGLNPETFFNPPSSYSASPFMATDDYAPSEPLDAAFFSAQLDDHGLFDFDYSPAASIFTDGSGGDDHNEKKMYVCFD
jgi:hypothetical protein